MLAMHIDLCAADTNHNTIMQYIESFAALLFSLNKLYQSKILLHVFIVCAFD